MGEGEFSTANQFMAHREERHDGKIRYYSNDAKLKGLVNDLEAPDCRLILNANNRCSWLNVWSTMVTGTVLVAT